jgi:hypothetical protein
MASRAKVVDTMVSPIRCFGSANERERAHDGHARRPASGATEPSFNQLAADVVAGDHSAREAL